MQQILQPPDSRTYSAEVTGLHRNLPHHRRLRPFRRSYILLQILPCVNHFLLPHGEAFPTKGPGPAALFLPIPSLFRNCRIGDKAPALSVAFCPELWEDDGEKTGVRLDVSSASFPMYQRKRLRNLPQAFPVLTGPPWVP